MNQAIIFLTIFAVLVVVAIILIRKNRRKNPNQHSGDPIEHFFHHLDDL